jgi:SAM-dependent methyltransferase
VNPSIEGGEVVSTNRVSKKRWLAAQEQEKRVIERAEDIKTRISERRRTWANLLELLKDDVTFDNSKRILDVGCGATTIFLALRQGTKYAVDPTLEHLFRSHPFVREVEEYRDVNFISGSIEEVNLDNQFDVIFMINVLDHVAELKPVIDKVHELLAPSGILILPVDCYADRVVRSIQRFFDADLPHPHHFVAEDVIALFPSYELVKYDRRAFEIFPDCVSSVQGGDIPIYRVDRFIAQKIQELDELGRKGDLLFAIKRFFSSSLCYFVTLLRRKERPLAGLKKRRLFIFQKQS